MSQKFDFGPSYFFLVCRNLGKDLLHCYLRFISKKCIKDLNQNVDTSLPQDKRYEVLLEDRQQWTQHNLDF